MTRHLLLRLLVAAACATTTGQPLAAAVTLSLGPAPVGGEVRQGGREHTETVTEQFTVGASGALDLSNIAGDVRVTGGSGDEIRIQAVKRVRHADAAEARRQLAALRVSMSNVRGRVEVRTEYPRTERRFSGSVAYTVSVPTGASVTVKTISGDVVLASVSGEVRAESVSGDLDIKRCPNLAHARTVSGDVLVQEVGSPSVLSLGTVSGNVVARGVKTQSVDAGAVSGDLRLSDIDVERIQAKSVSGTIEFGARLARGGRYEFTSHSGDVRLTLGDDTGFEINADTFSGGIRSDYPITLRDGSEGATARGRAGGTRAIRGTFGDASAIIAARSFSGSIIITKR
jgi:DUF4097 and DUF4098 domain-containing protein YvlB